MTSLSAVVKSIKARWRIIGEKDLPFFPSYANRHWRALFPRRKHRDPKIAIEDISWNAMGPQLDLIRSVIDIEVNDIRVGAYDLRIDYRGGRVKDTEKYLSDVYTRVSKAMQQIFNETLAVDNISIGCFSPLDDLYGQTADRLVVRMTISRAGNSKLNWTNTDIHSLYAISEQSEKEISVHIHPLILESLNN